MLIQYLSRFYLLAVITLAGIFVAPPVQASCALEQTACKASCNVRYFDDSLGRMACNTKCAAQRAACSAEESAEDAVEKTKRLMDN